MVYALIDSRVNEMIQSRLQKESFGIITLPPSKDLPEAIASHPDSLVTKIGNTLIFSADYSDDGVCALTDVREYAPHIKMILASEPMGKKYPQDTRYNALRIGDHLFCRTESISSSVKDEAERQGLTIVNVKQGYPHCSTLKLNDKAAITADSGMASAMEKCGIRVYRIETGNIALPPYEYGFIGGACGVFGGKIYFFGDYTAHPSRSVIEQSAKAEGLELISLTDGMLSDFGGIVFLDK